jgi:trigger factor
LNITLDKQSSTDGLIKINLTATDYQPKVEEKIKDYARKANIKGFRQGKVPTGVIKKMYGKSILVEEVNHIVSHSVSDYIRDQKLKILGDPMPNQEKAFGIDWDVQKDFEFEFQIGLVEDFTLELSPKAKVKSHTIEVDQKVIDETLEDLKKRFGNTTNPEASSANDSLYGDIVKGGETDKKGSFITIEKVAKKEQKKFIGVKKDDVIEFEIEKVFSDPLSISQTLNISEDEAKTATGTYTFTVTNISQTEPAQMNQEFFDKVFGKDAVANEADFIEKIKTTIGENYNRET